MKEVIAQKRAEARKLKSTSPALSDSPVLVDDPELVVPNKPQEEDTDDLGRWSLRETVERARGTGSSTDILVGLAVNDLQSVS